MKIIFLGDIAVHKAFNPQGFPELQSADLVVGNLEGALVPPEDIAHLPENAVYSSFDVLPHLRSFNIGAVSLANNHVFDVPIPITRTQQILETHGIKSFGAGANLKEASTAFSFRQCDRHIKIFGFGWNIIGCPPAGRTNAGTNPFDPRSLIETIKDVRSTDSDTFVIFVIHWNFELELYPQPAHRQLAHDLLAAGVDVVIGHHPHVAQGVEIVDGKPIVYSLGNWLFPLRQLGQFSLAFPSIANRELAIEMEVTGRNVEHLVLRWYHFDPQTNIITPTSIENVNDALVTELTPFGGMSHSRYLNWFKKHRTRRRGLPIYANYRHVASNRLQDRYVSIRQAIIQRFIWLGLKRGLSKRVF